MSRKVELWQRLFLIQVGLLRAYQRHADADGDGECVRAAVIIQQTRREWREVSEKLRRAYGHDVLWIEGQDE